MESAKIPKLFIVLLFFLSSQIFGQHRNAKWQLGSSGGTPFQIDFSSGSMLIQPLNRSMNMNRTNSSICNEAGTLLFYTNGIYIANALHDTMLNGSGLNPGSGTTAFNFLGLNTPQSTLILPDVSDTNQYYIFHLVSNQYHNLIADNLFYTKIDMSLDGGLGAVTQKNIVLRNDDFAPGELVATKHANGRDWWLICHQQLTGNFLKFLIDPTGIHGPFFQWIGIIKDYTGQAVFSPDGSVYASYDNTNGLEVFAFNRCNGEFSKYRHVDLLDGLLGAGVSISPSSRYIYVSSDLYLYQFDLWAANFSDYDTVAVFDGFYSPVPPYATNFYHQALAPDGKIYINSFSAVSHLTVIDDPDLPGSTCNVRQHGVLLPGTSRSIPNFPNYNLGPLLGVPCDSITSIDPVSEEDLSLRVFPNPITGSFNFEWMGSDNLIKVSLYDISGRKIECTWNSSPNNLNISVSIGHINAGLFFVKALSTKKTYIGKVIVAH